MAVWNKRKAERVGAEITAAGRGDVDYILADLALLKDVRRLVE